MDVRGSSDRHLHKLWSVYLRTPNETCLKEYIEIFLTRYGACIDTEFSHLEKGRYNAVPPMGPFKSEVVDYDKFLETISSELHRCATEFASQFDIGLLHYTEQLTKCLIVLCRNLENVVSVAQYNFMPYLVSIATAVLHKLSRENTEQVEELTSFVRAVIHLCECIYDPYFIWRNQLKGWNNDSGPLKHKPAELHVEVIPFFYECMVPSLASSENECYEQPLVDVGIQKRLFHMFGAIITGSQKNALKAICPATVDVLIRTLSRQPPSDPTSAQRHDSLVLKELVLHCLVRLIHMLHGSTAEQRQVEVGMVIEMYFQAFIRTEYLQHNVYMQEKMLEAIDRMLHLEKRKALQTILVSEGIFDTFVGFFHKMSDNAGPESQKLALAILTVMKSVMIGSKIAKQKFREKIGYSNFVQAFACLGEPSKDVLTTVLELVIEEEYKTDQDYMIHNVQAAMMLLQWLTSIQSHDLQPWLVDSLAHICCTGAHNRMQCCNEGVIMQILDTLSYHEQLHSTVVNRLIHMVSTLGTLSITCAELKQLIKLLKVKDGEAPHPYTIPIMHAMSVMAQRAEKESALHYLDLQTEDAGISTSNLGKPWSLGFTFHGWIFLDNEAPILKRGNFIRRQLYSITTENEEGFEAFFTPSGVLVIAVIVKKKYHSISIHDAPITDSQWHSVDVSHICAKGPFRKSHVTVYIDGRNVMASNLEFPPTSEDYKHCSIGSAGAHTHSYSHPTEPVPNKRSSAAWNAMTSMLPFPKSNETTSSVNSVPLGTQDAEFGIPVSLFGHLGSVILFDDAITEEKVKNLHNLGPNRLAVFQSEDSNGLGDLVGKIVLHYNAKASLGDTCQDLSSKQHDGKVKAHKCTTWDIKDVINSLGGIQVLFPLLEIVTSLPPGPDVVDAHVTQPYLPSPQLSVDSVKEGDWDLVPSRRITESSLQNNHIASFLTLLRNMIIPSAINQDTLLRENALATLGLLLQNVPGEQMTCNVLISLQLFVADVVGCSNTALLWQLYQYLIFDFRIWSRSPCDVRKEHIQYFHTIIKDDKHTFRKKYGVQYILDVIRTYYSSREVSGLSLDDNQEIRGALLGLIHFYVDREINYEELNQMLNFMLAVQEEYVICEVLDFFISLLKPGKKDQIFLLMFEPDMGELLYMFLTNQGHPIVLREKVLQVLLLLLRTDRVSDKDKVQLHLLERDMFPGLVSLVHSSNIYISARMLDAMLDLVLLTETPASTNALVSLLQLVAKCDNSNKLVATKKILKALLSRPTLLKNFAKQLSWQEAFTFLLVKRPKNLFLTQQYSESDSDVSNNNEEADSFAYHHRNGRLDSTSSSEAGMQGMFVMDLLAESDLGKSVLRMGVQLGEVNGGVEEELCQSVLLILFIILWKGIEGNHEEAWRKRGQILAALNYTEKENSELLKSQESLKKELLHLMLQGCITDLKETGLTNAAYTKNCVYLVRWLDQYLSEPHECKDVDKYSEKLIEDILMMYDLLTIWDVDHSWPEMEQLGLRILLAFAAQPDIVVCSIAAARLHTLLQTRPVEKLNETCYVMAEIDVILHTILTNKTSENAGEQYNFLIPVMKALVEKTYEMLEMKKYLPDLPSTYLSPSFYDDFKTYCFSEEWTNFIKKMVIPCKEQFVAVIFDDICATMKSYMHECHESMMSDGHTWKRSAGESKLKFQEMIESSFKHKVREEDKRYRNVMNQLRNQHAGVARQWRSTKMFFHGERGAWSKDYILELHYKLSSLENQSRMRPKLVPNHNFDPHTAASNLRDNISTPDTELEPEFPKVPGLLPGNLENIGDDRLGDDEWNMIEKTVNEKQEAAATVKEKMVCAEDCDLITVSMAIQGRLEVTTSHIYFWDTTHPNDPALNEDFKCSIAQLREIHFRRYNLRRSALEFFLVDQTNYFLNFQKKVRNKVYGYILGLRPPNLIYRGSRSPAELFKSSGLKEKWVKREISNFEYLMHLNTIAGRTYNDLSQYPVFPWILRDYTSETLDLNDPNVFRDLSKPIGVVNPNNEQEVQEKYEHFDDPEGRIPKFHYGTHYSNAAGVMHYMLRMEPFTALHIDLQSGKFDMADRQFHSIGGTWSLLMSSPNDVKELIPEFFYLPEFLQNINGFDLGKLQGTAGERVNDVILPRWARSPEDFIEKHMRALESDHVSAHLHHWIDLIFGYKQKGKAAVEAHNVFFYCTYEGAVDLDSIKDPQERKCLEDMINNFGQTPCQLLRDPHPPRMTLEEVSASRALRQERPLSVRLYQNSLVTRFVEASTETDPLVYITVPSNQARSILQHGYPDQMIAVSQRGLLASHGWLPYNKNVNNFFTFEKDPTLSSKKTQRQVPGPLSQDVQMSAQLFAVTPDARLLICAGHWDNSMRVYNLTKHKVTQRVQAHTDVVTCIDMDTCGLHVMSGSEDTTCMIWSIQYASGYAAQLQPRPLQILYGHDSRVTCVAMCVELDMAVSGSEDGTIIMHTIRRGTYVRTLRPMVERDMTLCVDRLVLSDVGQICALCTQTHGKAHKQDLHVYSINGKHLSTETVQQQVTHMAILDSTLLLGNVQGNLVFKELLGLHTLSSLSLLLPITALAVTEKHSHILVGLLDGKLLVIQKDGPPKEEKK